MLHSVELNAQKRDVGKQISKKIRCQGAIPGVFYAKGSPSRNIQVLPSALRPLVYTAQTKLINLLIDNDQLPCILKDVKFHPVTDEILHFDLLGISENQKLTVEVPFEFIGQPLGVRKGGIFQQVFHKCKITCLPKYLVSTIKVNTADLDVGASIHLKDIKLEGIEYSIPLDSLVCAVNIPRGKAGEALRESQKK